MNMTIQEKFNFEKMQKSNNLTYKNTFNLNLSETLNIIRSLEIHTKKKKKKIFKTLYVLDSLCNILISTYKHIYIFRVCLDRTYFDETEN